MTKYKITSDSVSYGQPGPYKGYNLKTNLSISQAIDEMRSNVMVKNIDIGVVYDTSQDSMGCYRRYKIEEDHSIETTWDNLTIDRKRAILETAGLKVE